MYITRKECPSCETVEYTYIRRNTQTKTCKCGTKMIAQDVGWEYFNPVMEFQEGNQWTNFRRVQISTVWEIDSRYADDIMTLWPKDNQENISSSKWKVIA